MAHELQMIFTFFFLRLTFIDYLSRPGATCLNSFHLHCTLMRLGLLHSPFISEETETEGSRVTQLISCRARICTVWLHNPCFQPAYSLLPLKHKFPNGPFMSFYYLLYSHSLTALSSYLRLQTNETLFHSSNLCRLWVVLKVCPSDQTALLSSLPFQNLSMLQEPVFTSNNQLEDMMLIIITPKLLATS